MGKIILASLKACLGFGTCPQALCIEFQAFSTLRPSVQAGSLRPCAKSNDAPRSIQYRLKQFQVMCVEHIQYRPLIPAPVDRTSASTRLYTNPWITLQEHKPSTSITHVACESKLHSAVSSFMHPCLGNWVVIGHAVVYFSQAPPAFSAGIKCRHCSY